MSDVCDGVKLILFLFSVFGTAGDGSQGLTRVLARSASALPQSHAPSSFVLLFILSQGLIKLLGLALGSGRSPGSL